jgi:hypothetical protein
MAAMPEIPDVALRALVLPLPPKIVVAELEEGIAIRASEYEWVQTTTPPTPLPSAVLFNNQKLVQARHFGVPGNLLPSLPGNVATTQSDEAGSLTNALQYDKTLKATIQDLYYSKSWLYQ